MPRPLLMPLCRLKNLIPVNFTWQPRSSGSQSTDSTPVNGRAPEQKDEERDAMCPSCKKGLSNSVRIYGKLKLCGRTPFTLMGPVSAETMFSCNVQNVH